jgi:hypothetical protein
MLTQISILIEILTTLILLMLFAWLFTNCIIGLLFLYHDIAKWIKTYLHNKKPQ